MFMRSREKRFEYWKYTKMRAQEKFEKKGSPNIILIKD